jgi:hypothetical protein
MGVLDTIIPIPNAGAAVAATPQLTMIDIANGMIFQYEILKYLCIFLLFLFALEILLFKPYFPWLKRVFTHKKLIGIMDRGGDLTFTEQIQLKNDMYYLGDRPLPFVKRYPFEYQLSGISTDILNLDLRIINSNVYKTWEKKMISEGYKTWKDIDTALMLNHIPATEQNENIIKKMGYSSWDEAFGLANPKGYTEKSVELQPYFKISNVEEISGYGYFIPPKSLGAETDDRIALASAAKAVNMRNTIIYGIIIVAVIMGLALAYKIVA